MAISHSCTGERFCCTAERFRGADSIGERWSSLCLSLVLLLLLGLFLAPGISVKAQQDDPVLGTLQALTADADLKREASRDAETLGSFPAGTPVVVMEGDDAWSRVVCQGVEGFVPTSLLGPYLADSEALDEEMDAVGEWELRTLDEIQRFQKEKNSARIWLILIPVLVLVIFGSGVIAVLWKPNRKGSPGAGKKK